MNGHLEVPRNANRKGEKKTGKSIESVSKTVTNGFFTVNSAWTVTTWNKAAERLSGVDAQSIIGQNLWHSFEGTIPSKIYLKYHDEPLQNIPFHFHQYWAEMGCWFDVITYYYNETLSISFKKSRPIPVAPPKNKNRILNELYRFVTEITNDCLWEWNIDGQELFWIDGGHQRVFGYNIINTLVSQQFWENCIHPDDRARVTKRLYALF